MKDELQLLLLRLVPSIAFLLSVGFDDDLDCYSIEVCCNLSYVRAKNIRAEMLNSSTNAWPSGTHILL